MKKKDKNYVKKRNNIKHTKYIMDENNNLYLTLPKLFPTPKNYSTKEENKNKGENFLKYNLGIIQDESQANEEYLDDSEYKKESADKSFSFSSESDLNEEEKFKLFEKLRTKNNFLVGQDQEANLPKIQNQTEQFLITSVFDTKKSSSLVQSDLNRGDSIFEKNGVPINKYVTYLKDDPVFQNIQAMVDKLRFIRSQNKVNNVQNKLSNADLFYYDKRKWGERKQTHSNKIIVDLKEFKNKRDSSIKKLFSTPRNSNKIEELLKVMKKGKI